MNDEILQCIICECGIAKDCEELKYSEYLRDYLDKHVLSELVKNNHELEKFIGTSKRFTLTFEYSDVSILSLNKSRIATILGLKGPALRLVAAEEHCVAVTFLVPSSTPDIVLTNFTPKQVEEFQALSIMCLKYDDYEFDFRTEVILGKFDEKFRTKLSITLAT